MKMIKVRRIIKMNRKELINLDNLAKIFSEFIIFYYLNLHLFEVLYSISIIFNLFKK